MPKRKSVSYIFYLSERSCVKSSSPCLKIAGGYGVKMTSPIGQSTRSMVDVLSNLSQYLHLHRHGHRRKGTSTYCLRMQSVLRSKYACSNFHAIGTLSSTYVISSTSAVICTYIAKTTSHRRVRSELEFLVVNVTFCRTAQDATALLNKLVTG